MIVCSSCIPCYLKQALNTLSRTGLSDYEVSGILNRVCGEIPALHLDRTPAENSSVILHKTAELAGIIDPFEKDKAESNRQAMEFWPHMREIIAQAEDPLFIAFKVAVAGNVVDLGILDGYNLKDSLGEALKVDFARNDYQDFLLKLSTGKNVLLIGDNSGEIAFDRLLVEELNRRGFSVTYVVKDGPVLNDATLTDAEMVGMEEVATLITTGSNFLGVVMEKSSSEFKQRLEEAACVISKGQANYESLESSAAAGDKTFFILKAKCEVIAENLGVELGELVFARNQVRQ